ncbi:aldo-keto reductase family 1 member D1-like [Carya illinoinensis]|uniref:aldo-keto reductase family 1 member D1-like n=1 Tax=Carya illinoinensis TaxID=32201 RepID=UPI001C723F94|nr:aldo-keto reductase family 1 member D1-like [Carya illinoinensis]
MDPSPPMTGPSVTIVATIRILHQVQLLITWKMLDISLMMGHFSLGNSSGATHAVNQFECHPYFQRDSLVKFCQKHGICATAHTPLGDVS